MPASVTIRCIQGPLQGEDFRFTKRASLLVGRANDCAIQIPKNEETMEVSRHHCLLELSPPLARIRDFGSLNGTYLNGERIGSRDPSQQPGCVSPDSPQRDLSHGDRIRLASVVLEIAIVVPSLCDECSEEIPDNQVVRALVDGKNHLCASCRIEKSARIKRDAEGQQREREAEAAHGTEKAKVSMFGHSDSVGSQSHSNRAATPEGTPPVPQYDPLALIRFLLEKARRGAPEVRNIRGFEIVRTLGQGGMGAVYLARKQATGEEVALKVMLPRVAADKKAVTLFQREMENATALRHPNIVQSFESGYAGKTFFLTMEVCNGGSIEDLMRESEGRLEVDQAVELILQALDGLQYMHTAPIPNVKLADGGFGQGFGLVHRDLKPANLFLNRRGSELTVKVADLGLAKAFDQAGLSGLTMTGQAAGSPPFMPRQQVVNYLYAKPEVDVWAVAATLYNMMTGAFPRDFPKGKDVWLTILQSSPIPILQRNPRIPFRVAEVIDVALVDNPGISFVTAQDFKRELRRAL